MNNTITVESKKRRYLRFAVSITVIICLMFLIMLIMFITIGKNNLNGSVQRVTGTVTKYGTDTIATVTLSDGKQYNVTCDHENIIDWTKYVGKEVTFITPASTFASNPWVLGIEVDGETLFDYAATLESSQQENKLTVLVTAILLGICILATCALAIWRANVAPNEERVLYHEFSEYLTMRQPSCKQFKYFNIALTVWLILYLLLGLLAAIFGGDTDDFANAPTAAKVLVFIDTAVLVVGAVGLPQFYKLYVIRKERQFYAEKLPFDFDDISHVFMRKSVKAQLQKEILDERQRNPDVYGDGGNGYDVTFEENGIVLSHPQENEPQAKPSADVHDVFADMPRESDEVFEGFGAPDSQPKIRLSYERANFEAVAHYRKGRNPMMIIVKSRIESREDLPEEFVNDVHIPLDVNLLKTLKAFNVSVENLQYLLDNKAELIAQNCKRKKPKQKAAE